MKVKKLDNSYLVRLERGEEVIDSLTSFAQNNEIAGGFFHGLGGASHAQLGLYKLSEDKQYHFKSFDGDLEIVGLNGNISTDEQKQIVAHAHASVSGEDLVVYGGHVKELIVAGTCEIFIDLRTEALSRQHDEQTGLKLLDLE